MLSRQAGLTPQPCGWRAIFNVGHADCAAAKSCKCKLGQYDQTAEQQLAQRVRAMADTRMVARFVP